MKYKVVLYQRFLETCPDGAGVIRGVNYEGTLDLPEQALALPQVGYYTVSGELVIVNAIPLDNEEV